jgi:hypothetical protein
MNVGSDNQEIKFASVLGWLIENGRDERGI